MRYNAFASLHAIQVLCVLWRIVCPLDVQMHALLYRVAVWADVFNGSRSILYNHVHSSSAYGWQKRHVACPGLADCVFDRHIPLYLQHHGSVQLILTLQKWKEKIPQACTHTNTQTHTHTRAHTYNHTRTYARVHTPAASREGRQSLGAPEWKGAHTHTHTCTHAHTHSTTHTRTHRGYSMFSIYRHAMIPVFLKMIFYLSIVYTVLVNNHNGYILLEA